MGCVVVFSFCSSRKPWHKGLGPDLQASIEKHLAEVAQHERNHQALMANCEKLLRSYQGALRSKLDQDQLDASRADFGPDGPVHSWGTDGQMETAPVFRSSFKTHPDVSNIPAKPGGGGNLRHIRKTKPHNSALPKSGITLMKEWLYAHVENPYPSQADKDNMVAETGLTIKQINNWFINARRRYLTNNKQPRPAVVQFRRKRDSIDDEDEEEEEEMDDHIDSINSNSFESGGERSW